MTEGILPLGTFLDAPAATGFAGSVSLQIDLRRHLGDPQALRRVLAENRAFCSDLLPLAV